MFPGVETIMVCANSVLAADPPVSLPSNVVPLQYGFQKASGFTEALAQLEELNASTVGICAGTGAWNNVSGSPASMLSNVHSAHHALAKSDGCVSVVAHWNSDPAFAHSIFAWPGFVASAGLAWNPTTPADFLESSLATLIDCHVIGDTSVPWGRCVLDLGKAEQLCGEGEKAINGRSLFLRLLTTPSDVALPEIASDNFQSAAQQVRRAQTQLLRAASNVSDVRLEAIRHELQLGSDLLLLAGRIGRALISSSTPKGSNSNVSSNCGLSNLQPTLKTDVANRLLSLTEQYRALWLSRYHPHGLQGSLAALTRLLKELIPEGPPVMAL